MINKFYKYYKPHKFLFFLDFGCAFVMSMLDLVFPVAARFMINDVFPKKDLNLVILISAGLLILYIARYILEYIVNYWGHVLGIRIEYDMRNELFNHLQKLSFSYFDNTRTGHIMSRLVNDLNEISELAHHGPEDLFITIVTLIGAFIIMMTINVKLALITFILVPLLLIFSLVKNKKMRSVFKDMRVKIAEVNAQIEDSISGVRVVKAFNNESHEMKKFEIGNRNFKDSREEAFKTMAQFFAGINLFSNLINLFVLALGGYMVYTQEITIGDMVGFLLYVSMFLQPIKRITTFVENYQKGIAGFDRFLENMEIEPDIKDSQKAKKVGRLNGDLKLENISFGYNDDATRVLENITLEVKKGQTLALVGPSGAGKTTLCSLIPRFYEIEEGRISIDGIDIKDMTQASLRENIGIVQQDVFLFSGTIKENIAYGALSASDEDIVKAAKAANAHEFIMKLENGYDTLVGERGVKLSGGQKQRISISRIFLKNPSILILDEATSALDSETEKLIQKALEDLSKDRTTLVIAHRLGTIMNADKIVVLTAEGILEEGNHETLMKSDGLYSKLYKSQFGGFVPDFA